MPDILKASTIASFDGRLRTELWLTVVENGTYDAGDGLLKPKYDLVSYTARHVAEREKIRRENGVHRVIMPSVLSLSGRSIEFLDKTANQRTYTLTRAEQAALRSLYPSGIPGSLQLSWEREIRGPMSPTFEQSVAAENEAAANGLTFTVTNPTSSNLLVICHGNADGDANSPSLSTGFSLGTSAVPSNFGPSMNILHKIATGSEGTSIVVTHTGSEADANSGWFAEISGMVSTSYTDGFNKTADAGSGVTSRSSNSITTTIADTLLIGAFGYAMDTSPTLFGFSNSFTQQAFIEGLAGASDHATRVGIRVVSATDTYSTTLSWTTSARCSGTIGAFVIDAATPPTGTVPASGTCINTYTTTAVPGMSVAAGTSSITQVTVSCTAGGFLTFDTTGTSVSLAGNGTNNVVMTLGASATEYTTVLDTLLMQGTTPDTTLTITLEPTDGTFPDSDQFTVSCDPAGVTITGTNANVIAAVGSLKIRLLVGQTHDTISLHVVDDTAGTPLEVDSDFIVGLSSYFNPPSVDSGGGTATKKDFTKYNEAVREGRRAR